MKSEKRKKLFAKKRAAKGACMKAPGGQSRYAAKQMIPPDARLAARAQKRLVERAPGTYRKPLHGEGFCGAGRGDDGFISPHLRELSIDLD